MRVALLAPLVSPIAPPFLGGAQALLADLAAGLASRGHVVTLYAAPGSQVPGVRVAPVEVDLAALTPARFHETGERGNAARTASPLRADAQAYLESYSFMRAYRAVGRSADEHDLVHAHAYDWPAYAYAGQQPLPVAHTLHLPALDPAIRDILAVVSPLGRHGAARLVTVSRACAATYAPYCQIDRVIYNGVDVARIPFGAAPATPPYLLFAGRISPEKGVEDALVIAQRAGRRLVLAGGIYDRDYFEERIAPRLALAGEGARYLGPVARERLWELMAGAEALLCPVQWEEPFGLVACEAQAAGTPIVGYRRGGLAEVVADGATGILVPPGDVAAATTALADARALDRAGCRVHVERLFGLAAMLEGYEALYRDMLAE